MRYSLICLSILGVVVVGCEQKQDTPPAPAAAAPKVEAPVVPAASVEPPIAAVAKPAEPQPAAPTTHPTAVEAQSKLELVMQYIKDRKYDLAEKLLSELDAHKSSLSVSLQGQISTAHTTLQTAKVAASASDALGGAKIPSFGK